MPTLMSQQRTHCESVLDCSLYKHSSYQMLRIGCINKHTPRLSDTITKHTEQPNTQQPSTQLWTVGLDSQSHLS